VTEPHPGLRPTPLTAWHQAHGARLVDLAGFNLPVQYPSGVLAEHAAVREKVGLFDITHMAEILVEGPEARTFLEGLVTNKLARKGIGQVVYTAMCREDGGVLDDMLVYHLAPGRWLVVCNAVNHDKILTWLQQRLPGAGVTLRDVSFETTLIAVQGPLAPELIGRIGDLNPHGEAIAALDFYRCLCPVVDGVEWVFSRTGYTGERGYEIYLPYRAARPLWEELLAAGADLDVLPIGLAARDTLRFEMGYCLYGHELSEEVSPLEAGLGWAVKFQKDDYVGKEALQRQKADGVPRRLIGLEIDGRAIARQGATVLCGTQAVGEVTSGNFSPTLRKSLALALVATQLPDAPIQVEIRGKRFACRVVPHPFLPARVKGDPQAGRCLPA